MNKKNKKVAIFVDGIFIPSYSGAANRFHYLTRYLQQNTGTDMVVFLCDRGWSSPSLIRKEKFTTYLIHPKLFRNLDFLESLLILEKIDILQFSTLELIIELGLPLSHKLNKHLIFEAHYEDYEFAKSIGSDDLILKSIKFLQSTFGKYFDQIIALSNEDNGLSKNLKVNHNEIKVIPSGIHVLDFPKNCFKPLSKKIIFFGNLYFGVNLQALKLIKKIIYPALKSIGFHFHIIGDISASDKNNLEEDNFVIVGKQADLYNSFKNSLFALAPVLHGSGIRIKILNYLNAGIPVITTSQGARGFPRKDLLIVEDDLRKYHEIIIKLSENKDYLKRISFEGRDFIQKNMSWKAISKNVSDVYDQILKKKIKNKENILDKVALLNFDDPPWIKEIIKGKRFKRNTPFVQISKKYIKIH